MAGVTSPRTGTPVPGKALQEIIDMQVEVLGSGGSQCINTIGIIERAAHRAGTLDRAVPALRVDRLDPKLESRRQDDQIMAAKSPHLDIQEQARLHGDLRRAGIEPFARVLNQRVLAAGTSGLLPAARLAGDRRQRARVSVGRVRRIVTLPWLARPPIGHGASSKLVQPKPGCSADLP